MPLTTADVLIPVWSISGQPTQKESQAVTESEDIPGGYKLLAPTCL